MEYSHRNGETDPPAVEGWYWILWQGDELYEWIAYYHPEGGWYDPDQDIPVVAVKYYYGPIPHP